MNKSKKQEENNPCTIHSVMCRILFMIVCGCVWAISYNLIALLPTFWHVGTPMFIGWGSRIVYQKMFA